MFAIILFLFFWIISIMGFIMEVLVCSIEERKFINRGFLIGPYCPIYGFGGILLLALSYFKDNLLIVFLLSMILCSILEYFVSYIMELLFKVRWWDYSNDPYNLNGRICLRNALAFGILGMILVCFVNPFIFNILYNLSDKVLIILGIITLVITLTDVILSLKVMQNIKISIDKLSNKGKFMDATNDIKRLIKNNLLERNFLYRRFAKSYNKFTCYKDELVVKIREVHNNNLEKIKMNRAHLLLIFIISGIIVGGLVQIFIDNYKYSFILGFGICIIVGSLYDKVRKK